MSVLVKRAIENHLNMLDKQLGSLQGDNKELTALESRLANEKDPFVKVLLEERVTRLKKAADKPSSFEQYQSELRDVQKYLRAAHAAMTKVPWYLKSNRGKQPAGSKTAAKKRAK